MNAPWLVFDSDFGDGARFVDAARLWHGRRRLFYAALCSAPPVLEQLPAALREQWPPFVAGLHRIEFDGAVLDVLIGDAATCLARLDGPFDEVVLAPADTQLSATMLARLMRSGARLACPAIDAARRQALQQAGFVFDSDAVAHLASRRPQASWTPPERRAVVIGAGLAGAAACERLCARGWAVTLVERHAQPAQEASGNLAGIVMPVLSKDDNPATRLARAAYLYTLRHWRRLGDVHDGQRCGVLQLARGAEHAQVQREIAASGAYPPGYARWLDPAEAGALLGASAPDGGWWFGQGGWARPASVCKVMLDACGTRLRRVFSTSALLLERHAGEWQVLDATGAIVAQAPTVIVACGNGAVAFKQAASLPLAAVRGQVTHLAAASVPQLPVLPLVVCREAYMTPPHDGITCVGASYDLDADAALRDSSQRDNLRKIAAIVGIAPFCAPLAGRVGFRCVAQDRLPLAGALPDPDVAGRCERLRDVPRHAGLFGLLGYASRGLIWAPLAAELLAARLEGEPAPLENDLAAALDPGRFLLKQRRQRL